MCPAPMMAIEVVGSPTPHQALDPSRGEEGDKDQGKQIRRHGGALAYALFYRRADYSTRLAFKRH